MEIDLNEIIISERFAQEENLVIGSTYQTYKVIGIYANTSLNYETYDPPRYNAYTYKEFDSNKDTTFLITLKSTTNAYDKIIDIGFIMDKIELDREYSKIVKDLEVSFTKDKIKILQRIIKRYSEISF